ncbi:MAG: glycosyltransferase family 4 protein [Candidatus Euphemobacter frigidus]|nr:glycosyltransferase family 4 protein [Candidatus Euphemobacter frigidus]MDP8275381.1 glycosyltransferase family 4 protein [Candidatus Euphemobacter frigidus]
MTGAIHQLLSVFDESDAQGHMALLLRGIFSRWGYRSEIFAGITAPGSNTAALPATRLPGDDSPADLLLYHASINSDVGELFRSSAGKQVLIYHNITPAEYFLKYDLFTYLECLKGRRGLSGFIPTCDLALADSSFNAAELRSLGFPRVELLPFPLNETRLDGRADSSILRRYGKDNRANVLFVGRLAPNKKQEDILSVFYYFQVVFRPDARLILVGPDNVPNYTKFLKRRIQELGLRNVIITGKVTPEELRAYYRVADLFLCLSEHEGFCVPLLESFYYRIPVVAYAAGAVPETLGGAGVLLNEKNPLKIASLLNRILNDENLMTKLLATQKRRLDQIKKFNYEEHLQQCLRSLIP